MQGRYTSHHQWTSQELMLLGMGLRKYYHDWRRISEEFLPHLNPTSIKNKFYKRPAEIADVIAELGMYRDQVDKYQPSLTDLRLIEARLQKELHEVQYSIYKILRQYYAQYSVSQPFISAVVRMQTSYAASAPNLSQLRVGYVDNPVFPYIAHYNYPDPRLYTAKFDAYIVQQIVNLRQPNASAADFCISGEWNSSDKYRSAEWRSSDKRVIPYVLDIKDEDRIASLLDNYSQQFPGFLSPQNSFEDIHK